MSNNEEQNQELKKKPFKGTLLGDFLETREQKYLLAFVAYTSGYLLVALTFFFVFNQVASVGILNTGEIPFGRAFVLICISSYCFLLGAVVAKRFNAVFPILAAVVFTTYLSMTLP